MCTNPLKGFRNGETKNGKPNYIITSYKVDHIEIDKNGSPIKAYDHFLSDQCVKPIFNYVEIPCGCCLECKLDYARQWADRCMLEAQEHEKNCFITLTYDDTKVPTSYGHNSITGEVNEFMTLKKEHLQLFMKRLREYLSRHYGITCRFFASGEYGSQTSRPHYHISLFGWMPEAVDYKGNPDLKLLKMSNLGYELYDSESIKKLWSYGNVMVTNMSWDTCNYVARYQVKKLKNSVPDSFYKDTGIEKEFVTMSRRPGIGMNWINSHSVCYATFSKNYINSPDGSISIGKNKYFDKVLEQIDPDAFIKLKDIRKHFQEERKKIGLLQSSLTYEQQNQVRANNIERKTKVLKKGVVDAF